MTHSIGAGSPGELLPLEKLSAELEEGVHLAEKYACQGPRYTSYPTAPHLHSEAALNALTKRQPVGEEESIEPLSLYLHVPFCRDICYYCACNKIITAKF